MGLITDEDVKALHPSPTPVIKIKIRKRKDGKISVVPQSKMS
jgi:hypothetical protein